ncbi:hypothetical protein KAFR_0E01060 [Kazachstania africana CBS 2517]|uniref:SET domain-containing protein n=1 Tax=Kazachstania africana (strain ATCC 22294 / BCRC 22015 / CBS 2517 / CECT 1963 / NBRC 1671 / NRRL Y-8276) TaxID=1071382 RepID=H2AV60_KAZAF|nr:hypothetical protein KAFR_0E01060 [Kazachstania africana CBS 2517]CCF58260.1 hypothetical protein KAFR_0E01060 [Kazachstania africana CBS 2517]
MSSTSREDVVDVLKFVENAQGKFLRDDLDVCESKLGGVGVFAKRDLPAGTTLLQLPKSAIFSASNSTISNLLVEEEIDGVLALNLAFIYETTVFREKSHWYPYLKSIQVVDSQGNISVPPGYWSEEAKDLLRGTTLDTLYDALSPQQEVYEGFEISLHVAKKWNQEFSLPLPEEYFQINDDNDQEEIETKFLKFVAVAYALASRVFEIDSFHESALVPVADLFNHHVTDPDVKFITLFDVCELCGEPGMCKHLIAEEYEAAQEEEELRSNTKQTDGVLDEDMIKELEAETVDVEEEEEPKEKTLNPDECVDIVLDKDVKAGVEIFNSYGPLSNVFLLSRHGFAVEGNPHDIVHFGKEMVKLVKGNRVYKERATWWRDQGYKTFVSWLKQYREEEDDDDEEEEEEEQEDHDHANCTDHDHSDERWLSQLDVDFYGEPTPHLWAIANLLAMKEPKYQKFVAQLANETTATTISALEDHTNTATKKLLVQLLELKRIPGPANFNPHLNLSQETLSHINNLLAAETAILTGATEHLSN